MEIFFGDGCTMDCIFCKIIKKEIPASILYEDEKILIFNDLNPEAPKHFLVIPKEHIASVNELNACNSDVISHIFTKINEVSQNIKELENGYRVVTNCGENAGQTVKHLHFHVLGGRKLSWPPG